MIDDLLGDGEVRRALPLIHGGDEPEEALARIAWSVLAEPGDGVAGALVHALGAADALRVVTGAGGALLPAIPRTQAVTEASGRWASRADPRAVRAAVLHAADVGARLVVPGSEWWPRELDDLEAHAPLVLWVRGDPNLLTAPERVAIVGARASSAYGETVAAEFAGDLATAGCVIVSGGAYGIDGVAHRAALAVGGDTIAFLAGGVDRPYPHGHAGLLTRIADAGAIVSEVPCGVAPTKWRFLSRNRLIAAVSHATVVIEAGWRSGSLNTAGHAAALGRPLGAVPGPVTSAASAGCHRLLREYDARCVTTSGDVRELWAPLGAEHPVSGGDSDDPDTIRLLDALSSRTAVSVQELARRSGLAPPRVRALLGLLELDDRVLRAAEGWRAARKEGAG